MGLWDHSSNNYNSDNNSGDDYSSRFQHSGRESDRRSGFWNSKRPNNGGFIIVIVVLFIAYIIYSRYSANAGITQSTEKRTKLENSYTVEENYDIDTGFTEELSYTKAGLKTFYETTGVAPYLYVSASDEMTSDEINAFAENYYAEQFDDEDHFLFVYQVNSDGTYYSAYKIGTTAATVMDDQAVTIFYDYLEKFRSDSSVDNSVLFQDVYNNTADRIMNKSQAFPTFILIVVIVLALGFSIYRYISVKRARQEGINPNDPEGRYGNGRQ